MVIQEEVRVVRFIEYDGIRFYPDQRGYWMAKKGPRTERPIRLHVYVWEKFNGPVPKGFHVHHKDRNKDNNEIKNLELMHRTEHLILHGADERIKAINRANLNLYSREAAAAWHKSEIGREVGRKNFEVTLRKYVGMKAKKTCVQCGKEYECAYVRRNISRYCSPECKAKYKWATRKTNVPQKCIICGADFFGNDKNHVNTCGPKCRRILTNRTREAKYGKSKKRVSNRI